MVIGEIQGVRCVVVDQRTPRAAANALLAAWPVRGVFGVGVACGVYEALDNEAELALGDVLVSAAIQDYDHRHIIKDRIRLAQPLDIIGPMLLGPGEAAASDVAHQREIAEVRGKHWAP